MDWTTIITAILALMFGSGGSVAWINWRASKRRPELENQATEANTESTAVATMRDAIEEIRKSNDHFQEVNSQREGEIEKLREKITELQKDLSLATTYICGNCGCSHRMPPSRGSGELWIQQLKKGEVTPNYDPIRCEVICIKKDKSE